MACSTGPAPGKTNGYNLVAATRSATSLAAGFHVFGIDWSPGKIVFTLDGAPYATRTPAPLPAGGKWVLEKPFYFILNLAVGGTFPGSPDAATRFPATRCSSTGSASTPAEATRNMCPPVRQTAAPGPPSAPIEAKWVRRLTCLLALIATLLGVSTVWSVEAAFALGRHCPRGPARISPAGPLSTRPAGVNDAECSGMGGWSRPTATGLSSRSDEFNGPAGTAPNASKWDVIYGGGGFGNDELQYYTRNSSNLALDGAGHLAVTALSGSYTGSDGVTRSYTSGAIQTKGLFQAKYGTFEARIEIPQGQGLWPAFWAIGSDVDSARLAAVRRDRHDGESRKRPVRRSTAAFTGRRREWPTATRSRPGSTPCASALPAGSTCTRRHLEPEQARLHPRRGRVRDLHARLTLSDRAVGVR